METIRPTWALFENCAVAMSCGASIEVLPSSSRHSDHLTRSRVSGPPSSWLVDCNKRNIMRADAAVRPKDAGDLPLL